MSVGQRLGLVAWLLGTFCLVRAIRQPLFRPDNLGLCPLCPKTRRSSSHDGLNRLSTPSVSPWSSSILCDRGRTSVDMEQFMLEHAERYRRLVAAFKPTTSGPKAADSTAASTEILVSTRLRPMLEDEINQGFPPGVYQRGRSNTVDVHELRRPVRGLPTINVSAPTKPRTQLKRPG